MVYELIISQTAETDLREAFLWYESQQVNLGFIFEKYFSKAIEKIQKKPLQTQIRYKEIRVAFLKKFPFGIHFTIIANQILIIAVFHTSLNPDKWNNR
jgi:toxin ParE1/3/4